MPKILEHFQVVFVGGKKIDSEINRARKQPRPPLPQRGTTATLTTVTATAAKNGVAALRATAPTALMVVGAAVVVNRRRASGRP